MDYVLLFDFSSFTICNIAVNVMPSTAAEARREIGRVRRHAPTLDEIVKERKARSWQRIEGKPSDFGNFIWVRNDRLIRVDASTHPNGDVVLVG